MSQRRLKGFAIGWCSLYAIISTKIQWFCKYHIHEFIGPDSIKIFLSWLTKQFLVNKSMEKLLRKWKHTVELEACKVGQSICSLWVLFQTPIYTEYSHIYGCLIPAKCCREQQPKAACSTDVHHSLQPRRQHSWEKLLEEHEKPQQWLEGKESPSGKWTRDWILPICTINDTSS